MKNNEKRAKNPIVLYEYRTKFKTVKKEKIIELTHTCKGVCNRYDIVKSAWLVKENYMRCSQCNIWFKEKNLRCLCCNQKLRKVRTKKNHNKRIDEKRYSV
tara:strand:+ start:989 stop:1291 length:303 start_codon:yes stop_codon:yes gene_type:complete